MNNQKKKNILVTCLRFSIYEEAGEQISTWQKTCGEIKELQIINFIRRTYMIRLINHYVN